MCNPTTQDYFSDDRVDDSGIGGGDRLLRHLRIPVQIRLNEQSGSYRISDQAFTHRKNEPGISVDLECLLHKAGKSERDRRGIMPNSFALIAITAGDARSHSTGVAWTPKPEEPSLEGFAALANEFHGEVICPISRSDTRKLASKANLIWVKSDMDLGIYSGQRPEIGGVA